MDFVTWLGIISIMVIAAALAYIVYILSLAKKFEVVRKMMDQAKADYPEFIQMTMDKSLEATKKTMGNLFKDED